MRTLARILPLVFAATLAACGDDDNTTQPNPRITLSLGQTAATIAQGGSVTVPVTITRTGGFGGTVTLSAENLPTGVTATFNPTSIASGNTTATLTIAANNTATAGTNNITIRASGTGVTAQTVTLPVTVSTSTTSGFTLLTGGLTAAAAAQGGSVSIPVVITRTGTFAGDVNLVAEGLPTGVTATFTPATLAAGQRVTTLTLNAAANATSSATATPITIRASGTGVSAQTQTLNFTVNPSTVSGFGVTATPAAFIVAPGQSATTSIALSRQAGFAGNVQFALEGAPAGVTATITPNPATAGTATVTINTATTTAPGVYQLTLRGTSAGATDRTSVMTLIVTGT